MKKEFSNLVDSKQAILGAFGVNLQSLNIVEVTKRIEDNLNKGLIDVDGFCTGLDALDLIKGGKRATIGEERTWGGKKYRRLAHGWEEVTDNNGPASQEQPKGNPKKPQDPKNTVQPQGPQPGTPEHHASQTPTEHLQNFIKNSKDETLVAAAKKELEKRGVHDSELHDDDKKSLESHVGQNDNPYTKEEKEKQHPKLTEKESNVSWDAGDIDSACKQFNTALEKLGADVYEDGDNIFISTTGPISKDFISKIESNEGVGGEDIADAGVHWLQPANEDEDEVINTYKTILKQLGHKVKTDSHFKGSDMYGFKIEPITEKQIKSPKNKDSKKQKDWTSPEHLDKNDHEDLAFVKTLHDAGKYDAAKRHFEQLDTNVREAVPSEVTDKWKKEEKTSKSKDSSKGEVIGKTKSGKPIYSDPKHKSHKDFTAQDHQDAADLHDRLADDYNTDALDLKDKEAAKKARFHIKQRQFHEDQI